MRLLSVEYIVTESNGLDASGTLYLFGEWGSESTDKFIKERIAEQKPQAVVIQKIRLLNSQPTSKIQISAEGLKTEIGTIKPCEIWPQAVF